MPLDFDRILRGRSEFTPETVKIECASLECTNIMEVGWEQAERLPRRYCDRCKLMHFEAHYENFLGRYGVPPRHQVPHDYWPPVNFPEEIEHWSLTLLGPPGSGKTWDGTRHFAHLAEPDMKRNLERMREGAVFDDAHCAWTSWAALLASARSEFDRESVKRRVIDQAMHAQVLLLDDVAAERSTDWASEQLYLVLSHRYDWELKTILTSNVETVAKLSDDARLVHRLRDGHVVKCTGNWRAK
jgi:Cdc6-like AAA superfamily ATPase